MQTLTQKRLPRTARPVAANGSWRANRNDICRIVQARTNTKRRLTGSMTRPRRTHTSSHARRPLEKTRTFVNFMTPSLVCKLRKAAWRICIKVHANVQCRAHSCKATHSAFGEGIPRDSLREIHMHTASHMSSTSSKSTTSFNASLLTAVVFSSPVVRRVLRRLVTVI